MWKYLRNIYRILTGFKYFLYEYIRFLKYCSWNENLNDNETRNYSSIIAYHGLEKSLSYRRRNPKSGWSYANRILDLLGIAKKNKGKGYHDIASKQVLERFINLPENVDDKRSGQIKKELKGYSDFNSHEEHGHINLSLNDYKNGVLKNPELFFNSRYSLREFKDKIVNIKEIERAVKLAMKSPSVCNRQAWGIYHTSDQKIKETVLSCQHGNKPFGISVPNIMIITADLKAFFSADERYQHWIDGGLMSMSLMYAFHSIGIATCALNWSAKPTDDLKLRKLVEISPSHSVIMVLAIGYPDTLNKVCASTRRPINEIFFDMKLKRPDK